MVGGWVGCTIWASLTDHQVSLLVGGGDIHGGMEYIKMLPILLSQCGFYFLICICIECDQKSVETRNLKIMDIIYPFAS